MKKRALILCLLVFYGNDNWAQTSSHSYPVLNEKCPAFRLDNIKNFSSDQVALETLKGKWLILDFWTMGCKACVTSLPKINQLQGEFKNDITFLLVGNNDRNNKGIEQFYETFRVRRQLNLAVAYDSSLFARFGIHFVPFVLIINPDGIVKAITDTRDINANNLRLLVNGGEPQFWRARTNFDAEDYSVKILSPLLIDGNGGEENDFMYRSLLAKWEPSTGSIVNKTIDQYKDNGIFQGVGATLKWLYKLAYIGKTDWAYGEEEYGQVTLDPRIEVSDARLFDVDFTTGRGLYTYSLIVPKEKSTKEYLQEVMQRDLKNYFGYEVSIETRTQPCWKLTAARGTASRLKTNGEQSHVDGDHMGFKFTNVSMDFFLSLIVSYHPQNLPLIDESGIDTNIDMKFEATMTDFEDIRRVLEMNGFHLVRSEKRMKILTIRDAK